jgi:hypothetical protein
MKKGEIWILAFVVACLVLVPTLIYSAQATDAKQGTVGVPITTGLTGSGNSAKTFYLELPSGVTSSAIKSGTLKYSGNNSVVGAITVENGKIKLTLKGNVTEETFPVLGTNGGFDDPFITIPGNSIWRYADGRRWQINDYKEDKGVNESYNVNAQDSSTPSAIPPKTTVSTKSDPVNPSTATWYKQDQTQVPYSSVIQSSIKLHPRDLVDDKGITDIKNGKFVITYTVPSKYRIPEEVSEGFGRGGHAKGWLYYVTLPYYFNADAKITSYSYAGTVTFDYTLPTEPTLTGNVAVLKPNPNPTKFDNKDVAVQLSLKGDLAAYSDVSNISEWIFYAKENGVDSTLQTKKEYSKVLSGTRSFDFTIPKSRISTDNFEQKYDLTVVVRFTKPVITKNGTISSLQQSFTAGVEVYKKDSPIPTDAPVSKPTLVPPVAVLDIPDSVWAGEDFWASGQRSYDPDGRIVEYKWTTPNAVDPVTGSDGWTWYPISQLGWQRVTLKVTDDDGLTKTTSGKIEVVQPIPSAALEIGGTKKENRKVTITNKSRSPEHYPIDDSKTVFTLEAVSGGTNAHIKYSGSLEGLKEKDVLFKKAGKYKATINVTNTAGFSDSTSITFDIAPDQPPVVYFSVPTKVFRSPPDGNKAMVSLSDMSFSPDYDFIGRRLWEYRYDSNNNGSFTDESWVIFSNENKNVLNLALNEVGKYEVRLTVFEEFDQPTIDEFVTQADRRSADSNTSQPPQPLNERIVEVDNRGPEVDWSW